MTVKPDEILRDNFAPWVLDLGLVPEEVGDGTAVLRLPWNDRLAREGGALSGQALMAAADTAVVLAVSGAKGGFVPMTTVQLSTSFQRPVVGKDVLVRVELSKLGRTLAFAEIDMTVDSATVAHASAVYAIIG
ncbi:PaaI family thioesterase [Actinomadura bangladeshensis]|uniref:PaaI family thioesterase n=1 Tax=Actinomadura bangladeshensis TaxID=453573 RepID=A0A4R4NAH9_9ACTN|nr:PaaI family thioesterase [Actinomadura bangladeshensis]TDC04007.1 PaaI family thioesterase [Actinomadura bangladeshensis]